MHEFRLAPMSSLFAVMTAALMGIPIAMFAAAAYTGNALIAVPAVFMGLIYASVWFYWRPGRFELRSEGLTAVFPLRRRVTHWGAITAVGRVDQQELKARYGRQLRVGAGGLWGGFGWLWSRKGWVEFYISRLDGMLLIERHGTAPLLLTPVNPDGLARSVRQRAGLGGPLT